MTLESGLSVKLEIFAPESHWKLLRDALGAIGVGRIGDYDHCCSVTAVRGSWRPLPGSQPFRGTIGEIEEGSEVKLEMNCPAALISDAFRIVRTLHPYETPLVNIVALLTPVL